MFKNIAFGSHKTIKESKASVGIHYKLEEPLDDYPLKLTDKLEHWANLKPDHIFIQRRKDGQWQNLTYAETFQKVKSIAQYLLDLNFKPLETIVILSENSIEHALLSLAAVHIGITYTPISPPYSLISNDFSKLKHCLELMSPKLIFAQDGQVY
ncbi:MAG TPA: AMP-binding protein [Saprospiraceae bacterium]|nr:AMP-binding protein [Saprospiraceae bacterium]